MRFHSIKLVGFKKYRRSQIDFGPGLNMFYGPNEAGKSTLHQALVTALYGLSRKSDWNLLHTRDDARTWGHAGECLIEMDYSVDGPPGKPAPQRFLLRRDISTGKVELFSLAADAAAEPSLVSENRDEVDRIIAEQMGIEDAYVFSRTVSICQADLAQAADMKRIADNIESVFAGPESVSASDAIEYLDKHVRKPLRKVKSESPGRLDQLTERLESLLKDMETVRREEQRRKDLAERIESLEQRLPVKKARLQELGQFIEKSEAKKRVEDRLDADRRRFNSLEDRIRNIDDCQKRLKELEEALDDLGPITLFDPDQLDAARVELERNRAELGAKAAACADRIATMQKRLKAAEELSDEIAVIEQHVGEAGKLATEDIDKIDARRREVVEKLKTAEEHVQSQGDRLEHVEHSVWGLEQFARKYPDLGDAWQLQSEWQRLELHRDEQQRMLERAKANQARHEAKRFPPTLGKLWIEVPLVLVIIVPLIAGVISESLAVKIVMGALFAGMAVWWGVWKIKRRIRREQWRADHRRLLAESEDAEKLWDEVAAAIDEFVARIGVPEERVRTFIEEYRSNQNDLKSLRREREQCVKDRDNALAEKEQAEKEGRLLAESYGCQNIAELRDRIADLRDMRRAIDKLSERLAGVLGLDRVLLRDQMLVTARITLADLGDERKRIEKEQMDLARQEADFLQRTSCDDLLQLTERTKRLRGMLATKDKLEASLEAYSGGKSLDDLVGEQRALTLQIKVAMAKLEDDFPGFEPTAEQNEMWRKERERLEFEIPELTNKLTAARTELKVLEEHATMSLAELEGEKEYTESEISRGDFLVTACGLAGEVLREIEQEHHSLYLPQIQGEASTHFARLTDGAYAAIDLLASWPQKIAVRDRDGRVIDAEKLSRGTIDQLYFALRLALARALSGRTSLPVLLDDPFVNFDAARFEQAVATMLGLVRDGRQVIYFTHSPQLAEREASWKEQGIRVSCVRLGE
ncbi:MAG TPA: AAA family ATPase [Planctomycetota bacterium]|nr:AAA family ATPase [Planctomycetota bacterium]